MIKTVQDIRVFVGDNGVAAFAVFWDKPAESNVGDWQMMPVVMGCNLHDFADQLMAFGEKLKAVSDEVKDGDNR